MDRCYPSLDVNVPSLPAYSSVQVYPHLFLSPLPIPPPLPALESAVLRVIALLPLPLSRPPTTCLVCDRAASRSHSLHDLRSVLRVVPTGWSPSFRLRPRSVALLLPPTLSAAHDASAAPSHGGTALVSSLTAHRSPELISGLRTLELCIGTPAPGSFDPTLNAVLRELMEVLRGLLKPSSTCNHNSHTAIRIPGDLGLNVRGLTKNREAHLFLAAVRAPSTRPAYLLEGGFCFICDAVPLLSDYPLPSLTIAPRPFSRSAYCYDTSRAVPSLTGGGTRRSRDPARALPSSESPCCRRLIKLVLPIYWGPEDPRALFTTAFIAPSSLPRAGVVYGKSTDHGFVREADDATDMKGMAALTQAASVSKISREEEGSTSSAMCYSCEV
ncbi:hypothetical protein LXA43DRAFT_1103701 [Ganoderma leucocontextum]|nr:hypothetical protein LXA43DRAFT_1103701 [Ganoderma leucocontextum]